MVNQRGPFAQQRAAKSVRQTIIGVAAPANAPSVPLAPRSFVERKAATALQAVRPPGPPQSAASPSVETAKKPNPNRTIIGGLDAAPGSAPAPQAVGLGVPSETKWNVLIPKQGAVEMTAPELVRAFVEGKLTRETNAWREGLDGWKPISEIEALRATFKRAGISLNPAPTEPAAALPSRSKVKPAPDLVKTPVVDTKALAPTHIQESRERSVPRLDVADSDDSDDEEVTRIAASPWDVPDVGAKAAERLASSAGLPSRQNSIPPTGHKAGDQVDHPQLERPSRRPDIGPRATVRGQLGAVSSMPAPPQRATGALAARPPPQPRIAGPAPSSALDPNPSSAVSTVPPPPVQGCAAMSAALAGSVDPIAATAQVVAHESDPTNSSLDDASNDALPKPRHARRRWWVVLLVVTGLTTCVGWSYHSRQPRALYAQLHRLGWDAPIDRTAQAIGPKIRNATQNYLVKPCRHIAQKLRGAPKK